MKEADVIRFPAFKVADAWKVSGYAFSFSSSLSGPLPFFLPPLALVLMILVLVDV